MAALGSFLACLNGLPDWIINHFTSWLVLSSYSCTKACIHYLCCLVTRYVSVDSTDHRINCDLEVKLEGVTYSCGCYLIPWGDRILGLRCHEVGGGAIMHRVLLALDLKSTFFYPFGHSIPCKNAIRRTPDLRTYPIIIILDLSSLVSHYSNLSQIVSLDLIHLIYVVFGT